MRMQHLLLAAGLGLPLILAAECKIAPAPAPASPPVASDQPAMPVVHDNRPSEPPMTTLDLGMPVPVDMAAPPIDLGPCPDGSVRCGRACANTATDPKNCGSCDNVCDSTQSCISTACVGSGKLQITATWDRIGNGDLVVTAPGGKTISWANLGPDDSTAGGMMDHDDTTGRGPDNIFWPDQAMPPAGKYLICFEASFFEPEPSMMKPVNATITVRRPGSDPKTFTKTVTAQASVDECKESDPTFVGSITYP